MDHEQFKAQQDCRNKYEERMIDELYIGAYNGEIASYDDLVAKYAMLDDEYSDEMQAEFGIIPMSLDHLFIDHARKAEADGRPLKDYAFTFLDIYNTLATPDFHLTPSGELKPKGRNGVTPDDPDSDPFWDKLLPNPDD